MPDIPNDSPPTDVDDKGKLLRTESGPPPQPEDKSPEKPKPTIKMPPFLWKQSQDLLREIEEKIRAKTLVYFTNPQTTINNDDVDYFFSHIKELKPDSPLALILISGGGNGMAAWRIANVLRSYCNHLTVVIPSQCASAATMLAMAAERLLFGPAGYLTAIDTSLNHPLNPKPERGQPTSISVDQVNRVRDFINEDLKNRPNGKSLSEILFEKIHPVAFGELQRSSSLSKLIARNMMSLRTNAPSDEEQVKIANMLNDSYPAHAYPIILKEAQRLGLPAEALQQDLVNPVWELNKLYSLISKRVITNITPALYHQEGIPAIIESSGKRTFFTISQDKRLMPQPGLGWVTENDKTRWLSATLNPESPDKPKFSEIEL